MKFRLAVDDHQFNDYTLISPLKGQNPIKLDEWIDDGEAEEIICEHILEYVPIENLLNFIKTLVAKLAHKGKLIIVNKDTTILAERFIRGEISIIDLNRQLFGEKNHAWNFKLSAISLIDITEICRIIGVKILERQLMVDEFIIKIERE